IQPDIVMCRSEMPLPENERRKIALFTNVDVRSVISAYDVDSIYKLPVVLHRQGLDEIVCRKLDLAAYPADLSMWERIVEALENPDHEVDIAMVGKYIDLQDSYKSLSEALKHAGIHTRNKCGLEGANSTEFDPDTPHPVIALVTEWQNRDGKVERRDAQSNLGGTMRLGAQPCTVKKGSLAWKIYGKDTVAERHRHRYEV